MLTNLPSPALPWQQNAINKVSDFFNRIFSFFGGSDRRRLKETFKLTGTFTDQNRHDRVPQSGGR